MKVTQPWEVWDTKTWTLLSQSSEEEIAKLSLKRNRTPGRRVVLLYRENSGALVKPKGKVRREPTTKQVYQSLRATGAPVLPGFEDRRQDG